MIVYFSGTGNSRYAAQMIADACDDKLIDAGEYIEEEGKNHCSSPSCSRAGNRTDS